MRIPGPNTMVLALLAIAVAVAAAGCGSSSDETTGASETTAPPASTSTSTTPEQEAPIGARAKSCEAGGLSGEVRVTGVSCELGRSLVAGWYKDSACSSPKGASRTSCRLGKFTCLGAVTDRGVAVACAAPGRSVAFLGREPS